jgi:5-methylcytosine-specific restriction endonuclease McrA
MTAVDRWRCEHRQISPPRLRRYKSGNSQFWRQCLDCGTNYGTCVAKARAAEECAGTPEAFDEALFEKGVAGGALQRLAAAQAEADEKRRAWFDWYDAYLQTAKWADTRRRVLDRSGGICEGCRRAAAEHVHHLTYAHVGRELLFELVALCRDCHATAHDGDADRWGAAT